MKKIIFCTVFVGVISVCVFLYFFTQEKVQKILVVKEKHTILYNFDDILQFTVFVNFDIERVFNEDTYADMHDGDELYKFMVQGFIVEKTHDEYYSDEMYEGYKISFNLPQIEGSYFLDKLYLKVYNDDLIKDFYLGSLYVQYDDNITYLPFTSLEGLKYEDTNHLKQIIIGVSDMVSIDQIYINGVSRDYILTDNLIIINIENDEYNFSNTFIYIETIDTCYYVFNFEYFMNYEIIQKGLFEIYIT